METRRHAVRHLLLSTISRKRLPRAVFGKWGESVRVNHGTAALLLLLTGSPLLIIALGRLKNEIQITV
jgi:hypothetical protein